MSDRERLALTEALGQWRRLIHARHHMSVAEFMALKARHHKVLHG